MLETDTTVTPARQRRRSARATPEAADEPTKRSSRLRRSAAEPQQPTSPQAAATVKARASRSRRPPIMPPATEAHDIAPDPLSPEPRPVDPEALNSLEPSQGAVGGVGGSVNHQAHGAGAPVDSSTGADSTGNETRRRPASRIRPAKPTFKQSALRAAENRFRDDSAREPVTGDLVDTMLVLLHMRGLSRSLVDTTYDFLRRGMSIRHATVQIAKLRSALALRA